MLKLCHQREPEPIVEGEEEDFLPGSSSVAGGPAHGSVQHQGAQHLEDTGLCAFCFYLFQKVP